MNESDLIEAMAEKLNLPSKTAASIVNTILEAMRIDYPPLFYRSRNLKQAILTIETRPK